MADIFISYKREDRGRIEPLALALEGYGYTVWWDLDLLPGQKWVKKIRAELKSAKCVIVVWTRESVDDDEAYNSEWIENEADEAHERGILVPVLLDEGRIAWTHRKLQFASLVGWSGDRKDPEFEKLIEGIAQHVAPSAPPEKAELEAWARAVQTETTDAFLAFVAAYPSSRFAAIARSRTAELERARVELDSAPSKGKLAGSLGLESVAGAKPPGRDRTSDKKQAGFSKRESVAGAKPPERDRTSDKKQTGFSDGESVAGAKPPERDRTSNKKQAGFSDGESVAGAKPPERDRTSDKKQTGFSDGESIAGAKPPERDRTSDKKQAGFSDGESVVGAKAPERDRTSDKKQAGFSNGESVAGAKPPERDRTLNKKQAGFSDGESVAGAKPPERDRTSDKKQAGFSDGESGSPQEKPMGFLDRHFAEGGTPPERDRALENAAALVGSGFTTNGGRTDASDPNSVGGKVQDATRAHGPVNQAERPLALYKLLSQLGVVAGTAQGSRPKSRRALWAAAAAVLILLPMTAGGVFLARQQVVEEQARAAEVEATAPEAEAARQAADAAQAARKQEDAARIAESFRIAAAEKNARGAPSGPQGAAAADAARVAESFRIAAAEQAQREAAQRTAAAAQPAAPAQRAATVPQKAQAQAARRLLISDFERIRPNNGGAFLEVGCRERPEPSTALAVLCETPYGRITTVMAAFTPTSDSNGVDRIHYALQLPRGRLDLTIRFDRGFFEEPTEISLWWY